MYSSHSTSDFPSEDPIEVWEALLNKLQPFSITPSSEGIFQGQLNLAKLGDIRLSTAKVTEHLLHKNAAEIAQSTNDELALIFPLYNSLGITQGDNRFRLSQGQGLVLDLNKPLTADFFEPHLTLNLTIPRELVAGLSDSLPKDSPILLDANQGMGLLLKNHCQTLLETLETIDCANVLDNLPGHLTHLIGLTLGVSAKSTEKVRPTAEQLRLKSIYNEIDNQLHDPDITPDRIASAVGISKAYLFKLLSRAHTSFRQEVLTRRLKKARKLLLQSNLSHLSVSEIAYRLGFNSHSHFSRSFQKAFDQSPTDFRKTRLQTKTDNERQFDLPNLSA